MICIAVRYTAEHIPTPQVKEKAKKSYKKDEHINQINQSVNQNRSIQHFHVSQINPSGRN